MMRYFDKKIVKVIPKDGSTPYETCLLSYMLTDYGFIYYVSGVEAIFPDFADISELDGSPLDLSDSRDINGNK